MKSRVAAPDVTLRLQRPPIVWSEPLLDETTTSFDPPPERGASTAAPTATRGRNGRAIGLAKPLRSVERAVCSVCLSGVSQSPMGNRLERSARARISVTIRIVPFGFPNEPAEPVWYGPTGVRSPGPPERSIRFPKVAWRVFGERRGRCRRPRKVRPTCSGGENVPRASESVWTSSGGFRSCERSKLMLELTPGNRMERAGCLRGPPRPDRSEVSLNAPPGNRMERFVWSRERARTATVPNCFGKRVQAAAGGTPGSCLSARRDLTHRRADGCARGAAGPVCSAPG